MKQQISQIKIIKSVKSAKIILNLQEKFLATPNSYQNKILEKFFTQICFQN